MEHRIGQYVSTINNTAKHNICKISGLKKNKKSPNGTNTTTMASVSGRKLAALSQSSVKVPYNNNNNNIRKVSQYPVNKNNTICCFINIGTESEAVSSTDFSRKTHINADQLF